MAEMLTARQARLNFFPSEVAEISKQINETIFKESPTSKSCTIECKHPINVIQHVADLYREQGFHVNTWSNMDGIYSIEFTWR